MKKRRLALLLGLLCAGLTACGSTDTAAKDETPSAPSVEQPEPEPTPEEVRRTAAEQYADGLTLEEQVAQMFFVRCPRCVSETGLVMRPLLPARAPHIGHTRSSSSKWIPQC